jgi:hypothetical protein
MAAIFPVGGSRNRLKRRLNFFYKIRLSDIIYYVHEKQEYAKREILVYTVLISSKYCVKIIFYLFFLISYVYKAVSTDRLSRSLSRSLF